MNFIRKLFTSYKFLVFLSVLLFALTIEIYVMDAMSESVQKYSLDLKRRLRDLRINETSTMLEKLEFSIKKDKLPVMESKDARDWLLEAVENFRNIYDAKIMEPVSTVNSSYAMTIRFRLVPENPADIVMLLNYMKNSISPIYQVQNVDFADEGSVRSVTIRVKVVQPFKGGSYVY